MKRYRVTIDGRIYDVEIDDPRARPVTARLSGVAYSVDVEPARSSDTDASVPASADGAEPDRAPPPDAAPEAPVMTGPIVGDAQALTAPIPGVVASVVATVGQAVERGDELLTIEAMKMFNVMRSPWAGTVATIHVTEGERVVHGQPLVTFGPS